MSKWDFVPFSSLYLIPSKNGLSRPKRVRGSGYKMINMGELFAYDRINNPDMELVPMNEREKEIYTVQPGDLLFARQSLVAEGAGKCSIVLRTPETTTFESHLIRARLNPEKAVPLFYYYYFTSPIGKSTVQSLVMQVAAAGIRGSELAQLPVPLPSLPIQRKIAAILSAYDDLIENNTRRIKILEEMVQLLYREWFVKFRFPGYEKVRMVESEMGPIPEGWEVGKLGEIIEFQKGKKAKNVIEEQCDGFIPYLLIDGLKNYNYAYTDDKKMLIAYETDCIMVMDGASSGYVSIGHYGAVGSTLARITIKGNLNSYFLYQFLQANYKIISDNNTGSAIPHTNKDFINGMLIPIPPVSLIRIYTDHIEPIFKLTWKLRKKNTILRSTRDLLLPKLISGELDVEDLDIAVGGD